MKDWLSKLANTTLASRKVCIEQLILCIVLEELLKEVEAMEELSHPNIVKVLGYKDNASYVDRNGEVKKVFYMALELAKGGELFDFIAITGPFSEKVARYYFHQLIETLEFMHEKGITHRDIKPDNILLDENFNLKLTDFGMVSRTLINKTNVGTQYYQAPEIVKGHGYYSHTVDVFAAGVVLFIMVFGSSPWVNANPSTDAHYKMIFLNLPEGFWEKHEESDPKTFKNWSEEFKNLLLHLFQARSVNRLSLSEIKEHPWYKGELPTQEEIYIEFREREELLEEASFRGSDEVPWEEPLPNAFTIGTVYRDVVEQLPELPGSERREWAYIPEFKTYTRFFSWSDIDSLFMTLIVYVTKVEAEYTIADDQYSVKIKYNQYETALELTVNILLVDTSQIDLGSETKPTNISEGQEVHCIEVIKEEGDR